MKITVEKSDKRSDILVAAEKLFAEFGYEGTSTRQIAKESGANMAMINYYFGSKEGVFMEIMSDRIASHKATLQEISKQQVPASEKIMKVIEQYVGKMTSNPCFYRMMQRELSLHQRPQVYFKIKDSITLNRRVIEEIIEDGVLKGDFRKIDVRMMISTIMGAISSVAQQPDRVFDEPDFNIENPEHLQKLNSRLTSFLQDLVKSYLIIPKNDQ